MLNRFIESIRHLNHVSGFEGYLMNVHRKGFAGEPTVEEARRDYQSAVRRDAMWLV